ncbi:hypothetical protein [uncultured Rhodoblastus sp.]|uniref:hypothetical protein n=1 Tax=uncultured Rhodoblastus sp. TaxID=543037 RepID=UPI0025E0187C|nr:hypothetical protein [uncultured Rhodoblastus sp.]
MDVSAAASTGSSGKTHRPHQTRSGERRFSDEREISDFDDIAFEFTGLPKEAASRNHHVLDVMAFIWSENESTPIVPE